MTQTQSTSIPYNGSGTINIHINNPSANVGGGMPQYCMPYIPYTAYPYYCYPANYYLGNLNNGGINQTTNVNTPVQQAGNGLKQFAQTNSASKADASVSATSAKDQKQREIVVLTDNYIKNLESYLRSNNADLRKNAIKEVLMRFKEDKSRLENPSLTALLNLALQDVNSSVRATAMSAIEAGYAKGDAQTEQILRALQTNKSNFSSDATQATDSLLQMSKTKAIVPDNSHYTDVQPKKKGA